MSWFDAMLGRVQSAGVDVLLGAGINFTGRLSAAFNGVTGLVDVTDELGAVPTPAEQSDWVPTDDTDALIVAAAGHTPGFYLVALTASITAGTISAGDLTPAYTWEDGPGVGALTDAAITMVEGDTYAVAPPRLIYSDGSADITAQFTSTLTGSGLAGIVRAVATRVSK